MAKKYSITWVDGEAVAVEVDGKRYKTAEQIPDEDDRDELLLMVRSFVNEEEGRQGSDPITRIVIPIFLAVGVLLLVIAALTGAGAARALASERSAPGMVADMARRYDTEGNEFFYPVVRFTLPDGRVQTVQTTEGSWPPVHQKNEQVTVLYDKNNPQVARIQSSSGAWYRWLWTIITGLLGVIFVGVYLVINRVFGYHPQRVKE